MQDLEQLCFQSVAEGLQEWQGRDLGKGPFGRGKPDGRSAFLAETILRFQCVEREEAEGKAGIHARQSGGKKAGETSEGLALEQLGALRGEGRGQNSD
jgi:hypothetical protein